MKTRDLIELLKKADPTGELECCVENHDIHYVDTLFAGYDGTLQVLVRDPKLTNCYNIVGGILRRSGRKVVIHPLSIEDALIDTTPESFPVTVEGVDDDATRQRLQAEVADWRRKANDPNAA